MRIPLVIAAFGIAVSSARRADAQDAAAMATRRELIAQAQQARVAGNHEQALAIAERASRIQMSPSLRLFVAQEQFALGRMAESYGNADQCRRDAENDSSLRNREQVVATCRALADDVRGRIARVSVQVPSPAPPGIHVRVGGNDLADALWGVPYVISAGHVSIDATAPGYAPFHREIDVAAGQSGEVTVRLEREGVASESNTTVTEPPRASETPPPPSGNRLPIGPIAVMGVGAVGIVLAPVFFFALRQPAADQALAICPNYECANAAAVTAAQPHRDEAATWNALTWVAGGVGVAALAGGIAWFVISRRAPSANTNATAWHVSPTGNGVVVGLHGTF